MDRKCLAVVVLMLVVATPAIVRAQASIAGVVKDPSGAVLPGVTVEAASPALIEKVRSVVSDGSGQYQVVDLRPGSYTVTFTLPGFNTVKREGIELTGSFAATVNVELKVGSVEETITVTGEAPTVDVQSVTQQRVLSKEVLDSIPSGRTPFTALVLLPGANTNAPDVGGTNALALAQVSMHGGRQGDTRVLVDGAQTSNGEQTGASSNFMPNMASTQEMTVDYAAGTAENATGGLRINLIPKEGGNAFKGSFFGTYVNDTFQGDNYTQDLKDRGLSAPNPIAYNYDVNPSFGGPILHDKLWFYTAARWVKTSTYVAGRFFNLNAGAANSWTYTPDPTRQAIEDISQRGTNLRLTWQASPRNKFSVFYDDQGRCWCNVYTFLAVAPSPEASWRLEWPVNKLTTIAWSSPLTSRLLAEARVSLRQETFDYTGGQPDGSEPLNLIPVVEQSSGIAYRGFGPGGLPYTTTANTIPNVLASMTYVTGSHALKLGFNQLWLTRSTDFHDNPFNLTYRFNNGIPNQLTQRAFPATRIEKIKADFGMFAQDKWTVERLTLNLGVRFDYFNSYFPDQVLRPTQFTPTSDFTFPETPWTSLKDIAPRFGVNYDLFGNGRTALKAAAGKYTIGLGVGSGSGVYGSSGNPAARISTQVTRTWNDLMFPAGDPRRGNFVPDCDLLSPALNGECGAMSDQNFGRQIASTTFDPELLSGWGRRIYQWEFSAGVQHQLMPRVSLDAGVFRRIYGNFSVTDNLLVASSDYSPFGITAPVDPRLPGGGGYEISGLYDLNQNKVGQINNFSTFASNYGEQIEHWNGVDVIVNVRARGGLLLQGGLSTGRTTTDNCDIVTKIDNPSPLYCHVDTAFLTQVKFLGSYLVPRVDVQISGSLQSIPGPQITAAYNAPNALIQPSLGRPLSNNAQNATVNIVAPGTMYAERMNQVDLRLAKIFRIGRTRTALNFDLYNALNANPVLALNNNFAVWQQPTRVLLARLAKISVNFDF